MTSAVKNKNGKTVILLNPAEKGVRYSHELKFKTKRNGKPLTPAEAGFRMGYLKARSEEAEIYVKKNGLKSKKRRKDNSDFGGEE
ncbi:MAG: hypothetical protein LBP79_04040 [Clostridiales bacterium]|jgi:hypothetical protein|nr:hypothetical protein [Clostridiales bacterium]